MADTNNQTGTTTAPVLRTHPRNRLELQAFLQDKLHLPEERVKFNPGPNVTMQYPFSVYEMLDTDSRSADNIPYKTATCYQLTLMDKNPDSPLPDIVRKWPRQRFVRHFVSNGVHHWVFRVWTLL